MKRWLMIVPLLPAVVAPPATAQDKPPIIDMHLHVLGPLPRTDSGQIAPRPCLPHSWCEGVPTVAKKEEDVLTMTVEAMRRHNIVLGFLSGRADRVYEWVEAEPDRFIASPFIFDPSEANLANLRDAYQSGRLQGMGELANQYRGIPPNDPALEPLFALAEEFDAPTLIHLQGIGGADKRFGISAGRPELLEDVLKRHPKLRIYLENTGFPRLAETISLMYMYPRVYGDLSTVTWIIPRQAFHNYLKGLIDAGLGKRLMFGSDQMQWPETIDLAIEAIESAPFLTEEQKRDIFYNNAARFLRLSEETIAKHHGR